MTKEVETSTMLLTLNKHQQQMKLTKSSPLTPIISSNLLILANSNSIDPMQSSKRTTKRSVTYNLRSNFTKLLSQCPPKLRSTKVNESVTICFQTFNPDADLDPTDQNKAQSEKISKTPLLQSLTKSKELENRCPNPMEFYVTHPVKLHKFTRESVDRYKIYQSPVEGASEFADHFE